ncbi:unnamed protein product [Rotaria socialis]|uniref:AIG1-type G domain-containing protein n=1 Tax=Rotaria socialis TaxID=392032 RepID=A0A821IG92_9BILA|nr:unnamed protein product [Rotaria socialis]CAF4697688.1 unnamed protein product [Rotaria socialis]
MLAGTSFFDVHRNYATTDCKFCFRGFHDKRLIIIDTPPVLVDYTKKENSNAILEQIKKCNAVLESNLRSILIVISSETKADEIDINLFFQQLYKHFGEETVQRKSILILTHLDLIVTEDQMSMTDHLQRNQHLTEWIQRCNGNYFDGSKLQAGVDVGKKSGEICSDIIEKIRMLRTFD